MFTIATDAAPGRPNEDFVIATPDTVVIVDGAGIAFGGCHHGIAWYARQLGTQTMAALMADQSIALTDALAEGISSVAGIHGGTCDLTNPGTPCAAVGILRIGTQRVDTLALSDAVIVVETGDGPQVTCDLSIETLNGTEPEAVAGMLFGTPEHTEALAQLVTRQTATRNKPDGWWVAAADPEAARHAEVASHARSDLHAAAAFSDGATRPVDQMGLYEWPTYLDMLAKLGPDGLIADVRRIESGDPYGSRFPRTKRHDDATAAFMTRSRP